MTEEQAQERFEGWAVVELFGHNREAGHVTTAYFGTSAMFRIDIPEMPEEEVEIGTSRYCNIDGVSKWLPAGSTVLRGSIPGKTRFVGPGAVYALNPCSEAAVRKILGAVGRVTKVVDVPNNKALPEPEFDDEQDED